MFISFFLAVLFVIMNGVTQLLYAQSLGYRLKPTGFAYFIGAIGNIATGNVVPISAQAETLTLGGLISNIRVRIGAFLIASVVGIILGLTGLMSFIVDFSGEIVISGMMAGVGLILSEVALKLCAKEKRVGFLSVIFALVSWALTHDLIVTIAISVLVSTIDFTLIQHRRVEVQQAMIDGDQQNIESEWRFWNKSYWADVKLIKPIINFSAVISGLGIICLNIGSNISFGKITAGIANTTIDVDALTIINSLADIPSILFGGMPLEAIISGTAAAPWPILAGITMMAMSGILILSGLIGKVGKYIPAQSIAGFLLIIGFSITLVPNMIAISSSDSPLEGIVAATVTMLTKNAFLGVVAGVLVKITGSLGGVL